MSDKIEQIREEIEEGHLKIDILTDLNSVEIGFSTTEESDFSVVGLNNKDNEVLSQFFETYQQSLKDIYYLYNPELTNEILPDKGSVEWCWEVGRTLSEGIGEDRTQKEKKTFIKPLSKKDDNIPNWKVIQAEHVYKAFPNKENLPDVNLDGSTSVFSMVCRVSDNQEEVNQIYDTLSASEMKYIEYKLWRDFREEDEISEEQLMSKAQHHAPDSTSQERKEKAVSRVKKIVG
jgi:hypothetical protein